MKNKTKQAMPSTTSKHLGKLSKAEEIAIIKGFARQCFLDIADADYIAARTLFRNECWDQFLYLAHQSIEKYLKAILLFNNVKYPQGGHNLEKLLNEVKEIKTIKLERKTEEFIKEIDHVNFIRYLSAPVHGERTYLIKLDETVWELRLFCGLTDERYKIDDEQAKDKLLDYSLAGGQIILFGYLEKILQNRNDKFTKQRNNLVWKNFRFGIRRKHQIKFASGMWYKNPIFFQGNDRWCKMAFNLLAKYVSLEKEIKDYFNNL